MQTILKDDWSIWQLRLPFFIPTELGRVLSFKAACQNSHTATALPKKKLVSDCDEVEDAEIIRQFTLEEAF